ncbi:MAG TPA: Smr/MutS family protein [Gammaproteobacteria bacterium]|nr:Smr/MutS family protein [Gammaproteobacteria bacterium]
MDGEEEVAAFREAMRDVKPLKAANRVTGSRARPAPVARHSRAARRAVLDESLNGILHEQPGGETEFARPGLPQHALRKLRRGGYSIGAEVDLHGMTRLEARDALKEFIAECTALGLGCVRVIHGKGSRSGPDGPVLKHAVHEWLARFKDVLAFTSATTRHGGTGAVYVLLRRR